MTLPEHVALPADIVAAIVRHAERERDAPTPAESCGLVIGTASAAASGRALRYVETANAVRSTDPAAAATRFEIEAGDLLRASLAADRRGESVWGIVHAHHDGPAVPSRLDLAGAHHPDAVHLIVSLDPARAGAGPELRGWWLRDGAAVEATVTRPAGTPRGG